MNPSLKPGVTIVELLIAIAVFGILSSVVIVAINPTRQLNQAVTASDIVQMNTIKSALNQYFAENTGYPNAITSSPQMICSEGFSEADCVSLEGTLTPVYMGGIPQRKTATEPYSGYYVYIGTNGAVRLATSQTVEATARAPQPLRAYNFDGDDDYIAIENDPALLITENMTISLWFNSANTLSSGLSNFIPFVNNIHTDTQSNDSYVFMVNTDGKLHFGSSGGNTQSTQALWAADTWYHVLGTFRNNGGNPEGELYINGSLEALSVDNFDTMSTPSNELWLGDASNGSYAPFEGKMFDVRIYNKSLTADEVTYVYSFGESGTNPTTSNLVAHYKSDDVNPVMAFDASGNNHHGVKSNTESSFHYVGDDVPYSWQNVVGYSSGYYYDGLDDYHDSGVTVPNATQGSMEAWFMLNEYTDSHNMIGGFQNDTTDRMALNVQTSNQDPKGYLGSLAGTLTTSTTIFTKLPYVFALDWNDGDATLDVNGAEVDASTYTGAPNTDYTMYIAGRNNQDTPELFLNGIIGRILLRNANTIAFDTRIDGFGTPYGNPVLEYIPRDESNTSYDILESPLQYAGPATSSSSSSSSSSAPAFSLHTDNLLARWTFEEGTGSSTDEPIGGYDGTLINMEEGDWQEDAPAALSATSTYSLEFDENTEYISTTFAPNLPSNEWSISIWFKSTNSTAGDRLALFSVVADTGTYSEVINLMMNHANCSVGELYFYARDTNSSSGDWTCSGSAYNDGNWHHVVWTHDGTTTEMYIDGTVDGSIATTGHSNDTYDLTGYPFYIGAYNFKNSHQDYFDGSLDDARFYTDVLSPAEISAIYNGLQ